MKKEEILEKLASGELKVDDASKLLEDIEQRQRGSLYCKVSQKGATSVYGLQRMPVTLYVEQWERLLDFAGDIRQFAKRMMRALNAKTAKQSPWPLRRVLKGSCVRLDDLQRANNDTGLAYVLDLR